MDAGRGKAWIVIFLWGALAIGGPVRAESMGRDGPPLVMTGRAFVNDVSVTVEGHILSLIHI